MAYEKKYYDNNKASYKAKNQANRVKIRQYLNDVKQQSGCKFCNESHPAALQFHHRDPKQKSIALSNVINQGWGIERINTEIAKCDVVCANCHLKLHYSEQNN